MTTLDIDNECKHDLTMKTINALEIRNHLGAVLDDLEQNGEPILVSKGRKLRAVLITPEDFKIRFVDKQAEEERERLRSEIESSRRARAGESDSLSVLRALRGYRD